MEEVPLNVKLQQQNLIHVCRLIIKSLLDKACRETVIEEGCRELHNLLAVLEHILMFQIKPHQSWYRTTETRWFWDYIRMACKDFPNNCIHSIDCLNNAKTPRGKGRGWLRLALMEKKLADYLTHAVQQKELTKSLYSPGSIVMGEEATIFVGNLVGLHAVDFSFDVKSATLDRDTCYIIDHTPYLTFNHNLNDDVQQQLFVTDFTSTIKKTDGVERHLQLLMDQKGYFEELVKLREDQLAEVHQDKAEILESLRRCEEDSRRQKQQLEAIIIELQSQLVTTRQQHSRQIRNLQRAFDASNDPNAKSVPLIEITAPTPTTKEAPYSFSQNSIGVQTEMRYILMSETRSLVSMTSTTSGGKEDTPSLIPMTGSYSSQDYGDGDKDNEQMLKILGESSTSDVKKKPTEGSPLSQISHKPDVSNHTVPAGDADERMDFHPVPESEGNTSQQGSDVTWNKPEEAPLELTKKTTRSNTTKSEPLNTNKRSMNDVTGEKSPPAKITLLSEEVTETVEDETVHDSSQQSEQSDLDFHMVSSASSTDSNNCKSKDKGEMEDCPDSVMSREHSMSPYYEILSGPSSSSSDTNEPTKKKKVPTATLR